MAKQFVKLGAVKVIIAARRKNELERVQKECGGESKVMIFELDLSKPKEVLARTKALFAKEKVDIIINNGGASMRDCFEDLKLEMIEQMMNVNCTSHIAVVQAALPGLMERK